MKQESCIEAHYVTYCPYDYQFRYLSIHNVHYSFSVFVIHEHLFTAHWGPNMKLPPTPHVILGLLSETLKPNGNRTQKIRDQNRIKNYKNPNGSYIFKSEKPKPNLDRTGIRIFWIYWKKNYFNTYKIKFINKKYLNKSE